MSTDSFTKALEPRNWFNMDAQMAGWGLPSGYDAEDAENRMRAAADAERARAEKEAKDAEEAAERQRKEDLKKRKGMSGTILTSGLGVTEDASRQYATLLGR